MRSGTPTRWARATWSALGAVAGLLVAVVVTLNVHIWVGLEQGYAATPSEVLDASILLGVVDAALLLVAPVAGAVALGRFRHRRQGTEVGDGPAPPPTRPV